MREDDGLDQDDSHQGGEKRSWINFKDRTRGISWQAGYVKEEARTPWSSLH